MKCDAWASMMSWWSCQSPVAHSCGLLNHLNSFHGEMFRLNAKFDADLLLYSLSHFECSGHTVHILTQQCLPPPLTNTVKLSLFTHAHPVHSPWLPSYINVMETILFILTMVGLFAERPCIFNFCTSFKACLFRWQCLNGMNGMVLDSYIEDCLQSVVEIHYMYLDR